MTSILIAAEVSESLRLLLQNDPRVTTIYSPCRSEAELIAQIAEHDVLVTRHYNRVTSSVIEAGRKLRLIAQGTSGIDNIAVDASSARGITIINTPGENANAVAEMVIAQMITLTRTLREYDTMIREGRWIREDCEQRHELRHFRLGLVGLGRVGAAVAKLAAAFGMKTRAFDPYIRDADFMQRGAEPASSLQALLETSDILSLHVPLTHETKNMIGAKELDALPSGAYLVNACRGEVLVFAELASRLKSGRIRGAALDVFHPEPPAHTLDDLPADRLLLTPHIAGCSFESKASIGRELYVAICRFLELEPRFS